MKFRLRGGWVLYGIICSAVIGVLVSQLSSAVTLTAVWTAPAPLTRTTLEENIPYNIKISNPDCVSTWLHLQDTYSSGHDVYNECWLMRPVGTTQSNGVGMIRIGNSAMMLLGDTTGRYRFAGWRLLRQGGGNTSWFYGMFIYDNPYQAAYEQQEQGLRKWYFSPSSKGGWLLTDPGTTDYTRTNAYATSGSGEWLVVETPWGMMRVNLNTREKLVFAGPQGTYGNGANPHLDIIVSDDGRYAIVANHADKVVKLFDMSTCNTAGITGQAVAKGCGQRDLTGDIYSAGIKHVSGIRFNTTGDGITFYATTSSNASNGTYTKYLLRAPGVAEYGMEYLALGDSYSSGEGDGDGGHYYMPGTDGNGAHVPQFAVPDIADYPYSKEKCHISLRSYPYLLAQQNSVRSEMFHTVACSGADANDVVNTLKATEDNESLRLNGHFDNLNFLKPEVLDLVKTRAVSNFVPGRAAQTEFISRYKPRVATIGIGGNDLGFETILKACASLGDPCEFATSKRGQIGHDISTTVFDHLNDTYKKLKTDSPQTKFYVLGYPQVFTSSGSCDINALLDQTERELATMTINYLNKIIKTAAENNGFIYLNIEDSLVGTNLCSGEEFPSVNGLTKGNDIDFFIGKESYHPNEVAHSIIANDIDDILGDKTLFTYTPSSTSACTVLTPCTAPAMPAYFRTTLTIFPQKIDTDIVIFKDTSRFVDVAAKQQFKPNSPVKVTLQSEPITINDRLIADETGSIEATVELPASAPTGYHELHLTGISLSGEAVDLYRPVMIYPSADDIDGDDIPDVSDPCPFVPPSHRDRDKDGIDDACDGRIGPAPAETKLPVTENPTPSSPPATVQNTQPQSVVQPAQPSTSPQTATPLTPAETPTATPDQTAVLSESVKAKADDENVPGKAPNAAAASVTSSPHSLLVIGSASPIAAGLLYLGYRFFRRR